ncbi:TRAP transporter small permease subunit [Hirschia maritima]|uniref:TRAP transporter small permease subunit n=1 Tax=Hirschia maritima TaxID=1121961 RepID=UPI00036107FF|nr:TRAP transporter small permease subunit [Hirschia maritima]
MAGTSSNNEPLQNTTNEVVGSKLVRQFGDNAAWIFMILIFAIVLQVILRKFNANQAWLDDAQWWLYGFSMTVAFGYAITTNSHVRVDILYDHYSPSKKAKTDIFALGWLLMPFIVLMIDVLFQYGLTSLKAGEGSDSPNGLHKLYILKMSLPFLFVLAGVATISKVIEHLRELNKFGVHFLLIGLFPGAVFTIERTLHYVVWWNLKIANPDMATARISRLPQFENLPLIALLTTLAAIGAGFTYSKFRKEA